MTNEARMPKRPKGDGQPVLHALRRILSFLRHLDIRHSSFIGVAFASKPAFAIFPAPREHSHQSIVGNLAAHSAAHGACDFDATPKE